MPGQANRQHPLTAVRGSPARGAGETPRSLSLIVLGDGNDVPLSVPELKRLAHQHLSVVNSVGTLGATWIVGAGALLEASRWARALC